MKNHKKVYRDVSPLKISLSSSVKRDIELKIIKGDYVVGGKIPTIVELSEIYGIGKTTAQKIIDDLYNDGVIVKKIGVGCFVKPFVREKLFMKHEEEIKMLIEKAVGYALELGMDKKNIIDMINSFMNN